jgi:AraC-like DNA-binding protein
LEPDWPSLAERQHGKEIAMMMLDSPDFAIPSINVVWENSTPRGPTVPRRSAECSDDIVWDLTLKDMSIARLSRREGGRVCGIAGTGWATVCVVRSGGVFLMAGCGNLLGPGEGILFIGPADPNMIMSENTTIEIVRFKEERLLSLVDMQPGTRQGVFPRVMTISAENALDDVAKLASASVGLRGLLADKMLDDLTHAVEHAVAAIAAGALWDQQRSTARATYCGYTRRALSHLRTNLENRLRIIALARVAGCSVRNLQLAFMRDIGHPPLVVHRNMKLEEAHRRLSGGGTSVKAVAHALGFSNPGRFAQEFRDRFGFAPSELLQKEAAAL